MVAYALDEAIARRGLIAKRWAASGKAPLPGGQRFSAESDYEPDDTPAEARASQSLAS